MIPVKRGPKDRKVVDVREPNELLKWAQYFRVSPQAVARAVAQVGDDAEAVAAFLKV